MTFDAYLTDKSFLLPPNNITVKHPHQRDHAKIVIKQQKAVL
jgi:hypothetical protein